MVCGKKVVRNYETRVNTRRKEMEGNQNRTEHNYTLVTDSVLVLVYLPENSWLSFGGQTQKIVCVNGRESERKRERQREREA